MIPDTLATADADKTTGAEFFASVFGGKSAFEKSRGAERAQAWSECRRAMAEAPRGRAAYWERQRHHDQCRERYCARLAEIDARYAEQLTEPVQCDPLLRRRAA